jgi:glycosyltransferase involved in cell wall biosynthesis
MRIGIVHSAFLHRGGAENLTLWLASGLAQRGHGVTLFAAGFALDQWSDIDLTGVEIVDLPDRHENFWHEPSRSRRHGRIIAEHSSEADVLVCGIHPAHLWLSQALAVMPRPPASILYCQEPRRKFYYMWTDWPTVAYVESGYRTLPFHDWLARGVRYRRRANRLSKVPLARWYDRRKLARLDRVVANSRFTADNASRAWRRSVDVCYPGVPVPATSTALSPVDRSGVVVLTGWEVAKNPMGVLGTINEVVHHFGRRDIPFTITGRDMRPEYEAYLREHDLSDVVTVRNYVSEGEKAALLQRARLCLFIPFAEPFGLVPVEAMLYQTPVIAADHGGPSEVVIDGKTGRLVDVFAPREVARTVVDLYDDTTLLAKFGRAGERLAREEYSLDALLERFEHQLSAAREQHHGRKTA